MIAAEELIPAIQELYNWQRSADADNFTALLYRLLTKADHRNMARLASAFQPEYAAFVLWQNAPNENEFFRTWLGNEFAG